LAELPCDLNGDRGTNKMIETQKYLTDARSAYYQHINTCAACKAAPYQEGVVGLPKKDRKKLCSDGAKLLVSYDQAVNLADEHAYWERGDVPRPGSIG